LRTQAQLVPPQSLNPNPNPNPNPKQSLNLRLNRLGDEGGKMLLDGMIEHSTLSLTLTPTLTLTLSLTLTRTRTRTLTLTLTLKGLSAGCVSMEIDAAEGGLASLTPNPNLNPIPNP